jgi:hypothetical protein
MKWFVASTYSIGNVIVRGRSKNDVLQFLDENNYEVYAIEPLNKYFNDEIGNEDNLIIEINNIIN